MTKWTKDECILALYAYCHVPFNKATNSNPWIVKIANVLGRKVTAVKMKIGNFGAFDPALKAHGIVGLANVSKMDKEVWDEYYGHWDRLAYDAERILSESSNGSLSNLKDLPKGVDEYQRAKRRINQDFFRASVLASYDNKCCVSGIIEPDLIEAAHIVSWADDESLRTNPTNGLCLNPLFHKAYDKFLVSITADYKIVLSDRFLESVEDETTHHYLESLQHREIFLPNRFWPDKDNLAKHYDAFRKAN